MDDALADDLLLGVPGGAEPLGVRADDGAVRGDEAKANASLLE
jgi:hypothetical protein